MLKRLLLAGASLLAMMVHAHADPVTIGSIVISGMLNTGLGGFLVAGSAAAYGSAVIAAGYVAATLGFAAANRPNLPKPGDVKQTIRAEEVPAYYGNGRADMPTVLFFGNTNHPLIYRLYGHVTGPIDYVESYFINGREVVVDTDGKVLTPPYISWEYGIGEGELEIVSSLQILEKDGETTDTAWSELTGAFPTIYTSDHTIPGIAQTLMIITSPGIASDPGAYQKLFSAGPELEFIKRGRLSKVYDPRKDSTNGGTGSHRGDDPSTWEWSDNGILNAVDIHRKVNPNIASGRYDWALIASEATRADASVTIPGGTEPRSRFGGVWAAEGGRNDLFQEVLDSIGAERRITAEDKYWFQLIDDTRTAEIAFTDDDQYSVNWKPGPDAVERPNIARVKYLSSERRYKIAELPLHEYDSGSGGYAAATWARIEDEIDAYGEKPFEREYPYCPSAYQAQRNLRREFAYARADAGEIITDMSGWAAWGCHVATIEIDGANNTCEIGAPRGNDEPGRVAIPYKVIPTLSAMIADDYVAPAPVVPDIPTDSEIGIPSAPSEAVQITYPDDTKEVRVLLPSVSGASRYFPVMREYTEYPNRPERWQIMNCVAGSRVGFVAEDLLGDPLDFMYLASDNGTDEFSDYGPEFNVVSLAANNTACGAPTLSNPVYDVGGPTFTFDVEVSELRAAYVIVEEDSSGSYVQLGDEIKVRPSQTYEVDHTGFDVGDLPITYRVTTYTSDGTAGTPVTIENDGT